MNKRLLVLILASLCCTQISACGIASSDAKKTNEMREVTLSEEENEQLLSTILLFIEGQGDAELSNLAPGVTLDSNDKITGIANKEFKFYTSSGAAYLQIDSYMYRFQLNNKGEIVSYIRYTLEA